MLRPPRGERRIVVGERDSICARSWQHFRGALMDFEAALGLSGVAARIYSTKNCSGV